MTGNRMKKKGSKKVPILESQSREVSIEDLDSELEDTADDAEPNDALNEPSEDEIQSSLPQMLPSNTEVEIFSTVSGADPLKRYLDEIRHIPLLDPEAEFQLAMQLKEKGDMDAARRLVSANLRLVVKIAFEYRSIYSNIMDLIQEGNIGLMKAVSKFDPTKGARLSYYSSWWIRSFILKYLLDNFRLVKIGTTQAQKKLFYHLLREKERLEAQGLLAGPKLLAQRLDVREKDVLEMEQRLSSRGSEMPLDAPVTAGDGESGRTTHMDLLSDPHETADHALEREQLLNMLQEKLPEFQIGLNDKERRLLQDRLLAEEPKTLQEVADLYGLTRERARQIEAKVLHKLREFLTHEGWPLND